MLRRLATLLVAALAAVGAGSGSAAALSLPAPSDWVQYGWRDDGSGVIGLGAYPGATVVAVSHCRGSVPSGCEPLAAPGPDGYPLPADTQPGDVFTLRTSDGGFGLTVPYQGPIRPTASPQVVGDPRVGAEVRTVAGAWSGGFGSEEMADRMQLQACRDAAGNGCVNITTGSSWGCTRGVTVVPQRFTGWYLRAADWRATRYLVVPAELRPSPESYPAYRPGPLVSVSQPVGPIAAGPAPRDDCVPPPATQPQFRFRQRVGRERGRLALARVLCAETCDVVALVQRGRRAALATGVAPYGRWTALTLTERAARWLGPGTLRVQMLRAGKSIFSLITDDHETLLGRRLVPGSGSKKAKPKRKQPARSRRG